MSNHYLEHRLSTPENVDVLQVTNRGKETSFFDPHLTTQEKMKIPQPYCTSTKHTKS